MISSSRIGRKEIYCKRAGHKQGAATAAIRDQQGKKLDVSAIERDICSGDVAADCVRERWGNIMDICCTYNAIFFFFLDVVSAGDFLKFIRRR